MVLIEAFAAGTPVVASDIAGYRQVVTPRPRRIARAARRQPLELAEALRSLWLDPVGRGGDGRAPRGSVPPTSPGRESHAGVTAVYERALAAPEPVERGRDAQRVKAGLRAA